MSRAEKYLPYVIALVVPMVGLINANVPLQDLELGRLIFNYLFISIILLLIWYYNKWLIVKTNNYPFRTKYVLLVAANACLIAVLSLINLIEFSELLQSRVPIWLIIFRLSMIVLIFNVILRVFQSQKEKSELQLQNLSLQAENLKFQVDTLKQQINPHFLFNSLNTLLDLIEEDQEEAIKYVRNFSKIYRAVLHSARHDFIPLEDELDFLKEYWALLKVRFHDAIQLNIEVDMDKMSALVPPLSLQFLVENAVKHNEASAKNPLSIDIIQINNTIEVRNKINIKSTVQSEKLGLQNLQQRFSLLHRPIEWKTEAGYFKVSIPLKGKQ